MSGKKIINLSYIVNAIEETTRDWKNFYNIVTGKIESIPDSDNSFADMEEFKEICEKIDNSKDYVRLPSSLKRGVLSEDGIYNLLERIKELKEMLK